MNEKTNIAGTLSGMLNRARWWRMFPTDGSAFPHPGTECEIDPASNRCEWCGKMVEYLMERGVGVPR